MEIYRALTTDSLNARQLYKATVYLKTVAFLLYRKKMTNEDSKEQEAD